MQTNSYNNKREEVTYGVMFTWNGTVQFSCVRGCGELRQQYFSHQGAGIAYIGVTAGEA